MPEKVKTNRLAVDGTTAVPSAAPTTATGGVLTGYFDGLKNHVLSICPDNAERTQALAELDLAAAYAQGSLSRRGV